MPPRTVSIGHGLKWIAGGWETFKRNPVGWSTLTGLLLALNAFSCDITLPAFWSMERSLGAPIEHVQAVIPVFLFCSAIGQLVFGPASDAFGRKPVILAGGLNADNVREAIHAVRPAGVDVHTGIEGQDGRKQRDLTLLFVAEAHAAFDAQRRERRLGPAIDHGLGVEAQVMVATRTDARALQDDGLAMRADPGLARGRNASAHVPVSAWASRPC